MENKLSVFFRKNTILVLLGMILIVGILTFWQFFSLDKLYVFTGFADDSYTSYLPSWYVDEALSHENLLSTYSFFHAAGNSYVQNIPLDPLGFVLFWISRLAMWMFGVKGVAAVYFYSKFLISFLGTGIFTYLWIRELNVGKFASLMAGLFAAFSGGIVVLSLWNIEMYGFYLAFYLFSMEQLLCKRRPWYLAIAVAMLASQPYQLYLYSMFLAIYLIFRFIILKYSFRRVLVTVLWIVGMGLLGMLINLPALLNSLTVQMNTPRMTGVNEVNDFASSFFVDGGMMSSIVLRLFGHNIPGNEFFVNQWNNLLEAPALYCGILSLLVFPQIFLHLGIRKRILYSIFIVFWFMVLFINPLRQALVLNAGDYFRYGIDFFFIFAMLMIMAQSLNVIVVRRSVNMPLLIGTGVLCFMLLWIYSGKMLEYNGIVENLWLMYFGVAVMVLDIVLLVFLINSTNRQLIKALICSLSLIEVFVLTSSVFSERGCVSAMDLEFSKANYDDGIGKTLDEIRRNDNSLFYRVDTDYYLGKSKNTCPNFNQVLGYYSTLGYNSFNQPEFVRFLQSTGMACPDVEGDSRWLRGVNHDVFTMNFMGIKYLISNKLDTTQFPMSVLMNTQHYQCGKNMVYKFNNAMPLGFTVDKYLTTSEFQSLLTFTVRESHFEHIIQRLKDAGLSPREDVSVALGELLNMSFRSYDDVKAYCNSHFPAEYAYWIAAGIYFASHEGHIQGFTMLRAAALDDDLDIDLSGMERVDIEELRRPEYLRTLSNAVYDSTAKAAISESLDITSFSNNHIEGNISVLKEKILVLTIPYDKAWRCTVDGERCDLLKCNVGFSGLRLQPGKTHKIVLDYVPLYRETAIWISAIVALLFYFFAAFGARRSIRMS